MLTELQLQQPKRRRALPSLRQQYQTYILQRIEEYKNSLTRHQLLGLGDEAVAEMDTDHQEQLSLTELLLEGWVDSMIQRRLNLPPYGRWVRSFKPLRDAQKVPTHWGLDPRSPVARVLPRLEQGDTALVIGQDVAPVAFLLAAHEVQTTFTGADLTFVDQVEARAAEEVLGHCVTTLVAPIGHFIAGIPQEANIVVIDTASLGGLPATARQTLIQSLMDRTSPEGVHLILPSGRKMMPEAFASHYSEWTADSRRPDRRQKSRSLGVLFSKPPEVNQSSVQKDVGQPSPRKSGGATA
ncbi:MAG: hypothetical protein OEW17_08365 [Gemmatimonadota bacterium]|nr:hypothetical protein [Gemmatimonadota bacterium]MDH4348805.1 hypothetical protein [Gemmatimonadota bacterium]MDH5284240.1 hypothetical protein [Gemmatimonadota bacterium]